MDYTDSPLEICLEQRWSAAERKIAAAALFAFTAFGAGTTFFPASPADIVTRTVFFILLCMVIAWMLLKSTFADDVRWTIRFGELRIERESSFGRKRVETIGIGDITDISVQKIGNDQGRSFYLDVRLQSSRHVISPYLATEEDAKAVEAGIRTWLQIL